VAGREETLLNQIRARVSIPRGSEVVVGIGDDCAVFRPRGAKEDLLFTTDQLLENVHFRRDTHAPPAAGHKALARGLSDIAAMGGTPKFCLVSLAAPAWADSRWISGFYRGLLRLAEQSGTMLAGGDLARAGAIAPWRACW
jgi:thiamine-monophosphate kinase